MRVKTIANKELRQKTTLRRTEVKNKRILP